VVGDRYGGEWPREQFRKQGVEYRLSEYVKSDLYRELLPLLNSQGVALLDVPRLLAQLCGLERRTARGGKDSIDHGPNAHDDVINSCAGAIVLAAQRAAQAPWMFFCNGVRLGGTTPVSLPVAAPSESPRPQGAELLSVPKTSLKFLTVEELQERQRLQSEAARQNTEFENKVARMGSWFPGE